MLLLLLLLLQLLLVPCPMENYEHQNHTRIWPMRRAAYFCVQRIYYFIYSSGLFLSPRPHVIAGSTVSNKNIHKNCIAFFGHGIFCNFWHQLSLQFDACVFFFTLYSSLFFFFLSFFVSFFSLFIYIFAFYFGFAFVTRCLGWNDNTK